ncbi:MAG TPA: hypothetical protein VGC89_12805, partial [Pyrinomonadaceae bacterium]
ASKRTRTILIVLVAASVLAFAGYLNSLKAGWMLSRLQKISNPQSEYVMDKLGYIPKDADDKRYLEFYSAVSRAYVENAFTIRVPFFGFSFDVNDLGLLGGLGFIVILALLRFSIRSEIVSLRLSFKAVAAEARKDPTQIALFYDLLAMRQVLTMPHVEDSERGWIAHRPLILQVVSKWLCFVPTLVYTFVAFHDFSTLDIGDVLDHKRTQFLVGYTIFFLIVIIALSVWCFVKWRYIDELWRGYWNDIQATLVR